jgi:hypothetical protein
MRIRSCESTFSEGSETTEVKPLNNQIFNHLIKKLFNLYYETNQISKVRHLWNNLLNNLKGDEIVQSEKKYGQLRHQYSDKDGNELFVRRMPTFLKHSQFY